MPSLDQHQSNSFVKLLLVGNSGSGKTGSLASLVPDYNLRILDMDNGLDVLKELVSIQHPARLSSIEYETLRDAYKASPQGPRVLTPRAYVKAVNLIDKWSDGSVPETWGPDHILVIDSLTMLGKAAYAWAVAQNPASKDPRQWYRGAQESLDNVLDAITSETFRTNVIVLSHIDIVETPEGLVKGAASAIGKALGNKIPRYFNTMLLAESRGVGKNVSRKIHTVPTSLLDLKNPAPTRVATEYPLETGLAEIFKTLRKPS